MTEWLEELDHRYMRLRPNVIDEEEFKRLTPMEQSYYSDMARLLHEVRQLYKRLADFSYVLDKVPAHDLITKVRAGALSDEDKA